MGIDSWTWDQPFDVMLKNERSEFMGAHFVGNKREYCHLENLVNLDKIPVPHGFKVAAFPIKIEGASGGWTRAVAILEES
jgi:kynurenine formamidase